MNPRIFIFSIAMGAQYSFYVKSIATFALTFFVFIISVLASVPRHVISEKFCRKTFSSEKQTE